LRRVYEPRNPNIFSVWVVHNGPHDIGLSIICNKRSSYLIIGGGFIVPKVLTLEDVKEITNLMELKTKELKESNG
jgi:hypothetical protein